MPDWMKDLENLVKGMGKDNDESDDYEGDEGDEGEEDEEETPQPQPRAKKSVTDPKPNAETTNSGGEPGVHNANSLDRRTGGGSAPMRKGIEDVVSDDAADALEVSGVLGELAKGINTLASGNDARVERVERRMARLEKGLEVIGTAVAKGLSLQSDTAKSLREDVDAISRQPAGRKSVTKSIERNFAGNDGEEAPVLPNASEIMTKSMRALKAGTISAQQASVLESARQQGKWSEVAPLWDRIKDC